MWPFSTIKKLNQAVIEAQERFDAAARLNVTASNNVKVALDACDLLKERLDNQAMRLVACGVGALANTPESAEQQRVSKASPYYSPTVQDVYDAVDREMALRAQVEDFKEVLAQLSCLGNGISPGNSDGNLIAIRALEKYSAKNTES